MVNNESMGHLSLYEDELYGQHEAIEPASEMIFFLLADEWYAVDILHVKEILSTQVLTPLPNVPNHVVGIISLRGMIVPVIHLKAIFGLPLTEDIAGTRVMVIAQEDMMVGVLVDAADRVVSVPISKIEKKLSTLQGDKAEWIEGQIENEGRIVAMLDVKRLIDKTRL